MYIPNLSTLYSSKNDIIYIRIHHFEFILRSYFEGPSGCTSSFSGSLRHTFKSLRLSWVWENPNVRFKKCNKADLHARHVKYISRCMTKPTRWHGLPVKTQISLTIRPSWSESSLSACRNLGSLASHKVHSEDWLDWADAQTYVSPRWAHRSFCWFCHAAAHMFV